MTQSKTLRRWELALLLGVALAALLGVWLDGAQAALSDRVIRLHVPVSYTHLTLPTICSV